ncbi:MAG: hypothetical protein EBX50_18115 [Chitinophagia bacterium]|nr:hypothetical protein [Chitinophagia bacterium]
MVRARCGFEGRSATSGDKERARVRVVGLREVDIVTRIERHIAGRRRDQEAAARTARIGSKQVDGVAGFQQESATVRGDLARVRGAERGRVVARCVDVGRSIEGQRA